MLAVMISACVGVNLRTSGPNQRFRLLQNYTRRKKLVSKHLQSYQMHQDPVESCQLRFPSTVKRAPTSENTLYMKTSVSGATPTNLSNFVSESANSSGRGIVLPLILSRNDACHMRAMPQGIHRIEVRSLWMLPL